MKITSEKYTEKIMEVAYYNFPLVHPKETVHKIITELIDEYAKQQSDAIEFVDWLETNYKGTYQVTYEEFLKQKNETN